MEYETSFTDLKEKVNLLDYIKSCGYKENKEKSTNRQYKF